MRIGIVAAEPSGDQLAAGLMAALRERIPGVRFEGIGGPAMLAGQMDCWEPMESLSVMGLFEVLAELPRLLALRRRVRDRWLANPPDLFIGVDAPDFNLGLEKRLKASGIPTVHYVCPTVWAWREGRVRKIRAAVDLLLALFPFEPEFLARHRVAATYVGHPFAREIPLHPDRGAAKQALGLDPDTRVVTLMPGSRRREVERIGPLFLQAAARLEVARPGLVFVAPFANQRTLDLFDSLRRSIAPGLTIHMQVGATRPHLAACDAVLVASGTATLEAMLYKRPMVVAYRFSRATLTVLGMTSLRKRKHFSMANILDPDKLAPEFIRDPYSADDLVTALEKYLDSPELVAKIERAYGKIHQGMMQDTNAMAADAVMGLLESRS